MNDIAFSVIIKNDGIDDIVFKTIMLKGEKGNSVARVEKTSTSGLVDTYTIYLTDGTIGGTFTVTNGSPVNIDDTVTAVDKTWSSNKLSGMIKSIDDNVVNADKLWSSQKINSMLAQTGTIEDVAMASFSDGADDVPLSELTVDIEAWQEGSGDASPDNERAIHGWNECNINKANTNLWDEQWEEGSYGVADGIKYANTNCIRCKNLIPIKAGIYYLHVGESTTTSPVFYKIFYDKDGNFLSNDLNGTLNRIFTVPDGAFYMSFWIGSSSFPCHTYNNDISINYPSTDTSYHAYDGGVDTIDLTETVYGGTLNVATGLMTIDHAILDLGDINWSRASSGGGSMYYFYKNIVGAKQIANYTDTQRKDLLSPIYSTPENLTNTIATTLSENYKTVLLYGDNAGSVAIRNDDYSDTSAFKTAMAGIKMIYPLETPTTIQLTPTEVMTLLGANNIFADTGNIEKMVYFKTGSEAVARMIEAYMRAQPEE